MSDIVTECSIFETVEKDGYSERRKILELSCGIEEEEGGSLVVVVCDELDLRTGMHGKIDYYTCLNLPQIKQVYEYLRMVIALAEGLDPL